MAVLPWEALGARLQPPPERAETELGAPVATAFGRDLGLPPGLATIYDWMVKPNVEMPFMPAAGIQIPRFGVPTKYLSALREVVNTARTKAPQLMPRLEGWDDVLLRPFRSKTFSGTKEYIERGRQPVVEVKLNTDLLQPDYLDEGARVLIHELGHLDVDKLSMPVLRLLSEEAVGQIPNRELASLWNDLISKSPSYKGRSAMEELVALMFENQAIPRTKALPTGPGSLQAYLDRFGSWRSQ